MGASDKYYKKASFSNYGPSVKIIAPGQDIISASNTDSIALVSKSGTSMASPMVAGIMAIYIGWEGIDNNVDAVVSRLMKNAIPNILTGFDSTTPNIFANSGINNPKKGN